MKAYQLIISLALLVIGTSCMSQREKEKQEVREAAQRLFKAISEHDTLTVSEIYPRGHVYLREVFNESIIPVEDSIIQTENNNYTFCFHDTDSSDYEFRLKQSWLYFQKDTINNKFMVIESYGLAKWTEDDLKNRMLVSDWNIIKRLPTTDIWIKYSADLGEVDMVYRLNKCWTPLNVNDFYWETGYDNSAYGNIIIKNTSPYPFKGAKVTLTFFDINKNELFKKDLYSDELFESEESRLVSFHTNIINKARIMRPEVEPLENKMDVIYNNPNRVYTDYEILMGIPMCKLILQGTNQFYGITEEMITEQ